MSQPTIHMKRQVLEHYSFFRGADSELRARIEGIANILRRRPGEMLLAPETQHGCFLLVGRGSVRIFVASENGREVTLYHVNSGESCLINLCSDPVEPDGYPCAQAVSDTVAVLLSAAGICELMQVSDQVREYVWNTFSQRMTNVVRVVQSVTFESMERRVAGFLLDQFSDTELSAAEIHTTHAHIAAELGSAREVVSRLLKQFGQEGAIELGRGRIILRDEGKLRQFAAEAQPLIN